MGRRGPKPKPTGLKVLHGDEERRINRAEPVPPEGDVTPPGWLDGRARAVWERVVVVLEGMRVLTAADVEHLAVYCDAVARHSEAAQLVAAQGVVVTGSGGRGVKNPACQVARDYASIVTSYGGRLGLNPSDRSQLKVEPRSTRGRADDLLSSPERYLS